MDIDRYMVFDRNTVYDRIDDPDWLTGVAGSFGRANADELSQEEIFAQAYFEAQTDLEEAVAEIGRAFDERCEELRPEWYGSYQLMARGTVGRWDVTSIGHNYYSGRWVEAPTEEHPFRRVRTSPFASLVTDTGRDEGGDDRFGLFRDCEIDQIWEDREGTVHVRGVHHDGHVNVEVRAVPPDTEEREIDQFLDCDSDGYSADAHKGFLEDVWRKSVSANVSGRYGHRWTPANVDCAMTSLDAARPSPNALARAAATCAGFEGRHTDVRRSATTHLP